MDAGQLTTALPPSIGRTNSEFRTRHRRCGWRGTLGVVALMLFPGIVIPAVAVEAIGPDPCVVTQTLAVTNSVAPSPTPAFGSPYDVEVDPSGNIYVSDASSESAYRFDPAGSQTLHVGSLWDADGIAVDSAGNFYVGTGGGSLGAAIRKFDASGTQVADITGHDVNGQLGQGFLNPRGIAIDEANGFVYFSESGGGNSRVYRVAPDLDPTSVAILVDNPTPAPLFNSVGGVAVDPSGNVIVGGQTEVSAGVYAGAVWVFDSGGVQQTAITSGLSLQTWGVAVDDSGRIFVADSDTDSVYGFQPDGTLFLTLDNSAGIPSPAFAGPRGVDVTPDGRYLYVADRNSDAVYEFLIECPIAIQASVTHDWVAGHGFLPDTAIDVVVTESDGSTVKGEHMATSDGAGDFHVDRDTLGVDIVPGDVVHASDGPTIKDVTMVSPLSVTAGTGTAFGALPTGGSVELHLAGTACEVGASVSDADGGPVDGNWSYDYSATCPSGLGFFANGQVSFADGDGDSAVAETPPNLYIGASITEDWVSGSGFAPDSAVNVWINAATGGNPTMTVTTDYAGAFQTDAGIDLVGLDEITANDGSLSRSMTLAEPLSIDVDAGPPAAASGVLPTGDGVQIWVWGSDCSTSAFVLDSDNDTFDDGDWAVDLSADCPTGLGSDPDGVALRFDVSENFTQVRMPQPPQIRASVTSNWVSGGGFDANAGVEIWVNADPDLDPATGSAPTDGGGWFHWDSGVDLEFTGGVVVRDGAIERALILTGPLSIEADLDLMTASGTLPSGETVQVEMGGEDCGTGAPVADIDDDPVADGDWGPVDLSGDCPSGLGPNPGAQVVLFDGDGDGTVAEPPTPPVIQASMASLSDFVQGNGWVPGVFGDVTINPGDPDEMFLEDVFEPSPNGDWRVDPGIDLHAGDVVLVEQDPDGAPGNGDEIAKDTVLVEFTFDVIDPATETASGVATAPDSTEVYANVGNDFDGTDGHGMVLGGVWTVDFSPFDVTDDMGGQAHIGELIAPDGDGTAAEPTQPPRIQASMASFSDFVQGNGWVSGVFGDVTINPGDPGEMFFEDVFEPDPNGDWRVDPGVDLLDGDVVLVEQDPDGTPANGDEIVKDTMLVEFTFDLIDVDADVAVGTAPAATDGTEVYVNVGNESGGMDGIGVVSGGAWLVDFAPFDVTGDMGAQAFIDELVAPDGDATAAEPPQPPQIQASPDYDWIQGSGFMPNGLVDVWINADPMHDPPIEMVGTDGGGQFWFNPPIDLGFGDLIVASDGVIERELVLEGPLSIEVDGPTATAMGDLPVGAGVYVEIGGDDCGAGMSVEDADNGSVDGTWFADLSGDCLGGLGDNFGGQVFFYDGDGDATVAEPPQPPQIQASVTNHWIQGWGMAPNGTVDIWINADPLTEPATGTEGIDGNGNFQYHPPFSLSFGDLIVANDGVLERELLLEGPLSIEVDGPTATAMGELPTGAGVQVELGGDDCGFGAFVEDDDDGGAADGFWSADVSGDCPGGLGDNFGGRVYLYDGDGDATVAEPRQPAAIQANVTDDWINGRGFAVNASVDVWVDQNPASDPPLYTAGTDGNGDFWSNPPVGLYFSDTIVVSDGVNEKVLVLDGPLAIEFDPVAVTAQGDLPPGAEIGVDLNGDVCGASTMVADIDDGFEDSLWSVDLSGDCTGGLGPNAWAQASLTDADGDSTFVSAAPPPAIMASLTQNAIGGQGFEPNGVVDVSVNVVPTGTVGTDDRGEFWFNPPFDLLAGDLIIVSDGTISRALVIEDPLSIDMNYDTLTAAGDLPIGAEVQVRMQGNWCGTQGYVTDIDDGTDDGLWSVDLSGDCPGGLGADAWAQVHLYDNDGDATMAHAAHAPQIQGSVLDDSVSGSGFTSDTQVDVWVNLNPALDPPTASANTSSGGDFWFDQVALGSLDLVVGDTIVASDGVIERELVLEGPLTIEMDYTSLSAIGELPVGAAVQVQVNGNWCGAGAFVADGDDGADDGIWQADVSGGCPSGLGPDSNARVMLYDADFDATVAEAARAPQITASEMHDWINGNGFAPVATVDVWINVSTAGPPTASIVSDGEGSWGVDQPGDLMFGDVVTASDGVTERVLELEGPLSMLADFATLTAVGELPPGATVRVQFNGQDCGTDHWVADGDDGTEDGFWSVDASGQCAGGLGPNAGAHVLLYDADADATVAGAGQPPTIQASETNGWISGQGFLANSTVDVWINVASSGPPTTTAMTGGDGNFFVDSSTTGGLAFGDVVEASDGLSHRYLMLQGPLSIGLDLDLLVVLGDLPTGEGVQVHAMGPNCGTGRWVDDIDDGANDGFWFVDLSTVCPDGFGGDWGSSVQFFDDDGDATVAETLPPPRISSSVTADWIEGYNLDPNTPVKIYVNGDLVTTIGTDSGGGFYVESPGLGGIDLVLGDVVKADDDFKPKTLSLDGPMTIDVAAPQATASGQLPTGARVFFSLFNSVCGDFYNLEVDDGGDGAVDGLWTIDLSGDCPAGFGTGWDAQIDRYDADGDATIVMWVPPGDSDSDGLTNAEERNIYGTDPGDDDSDDDGLLDGAEVNTHLTNPNKRDTDGDGLTDGDEVNVHGTKPLKPDTDGDGLTDGDEVNVYGTKPLKPDTDGGSVNDGDEVAAGTDPLNPKDDLAGPPMASLLPARLLETRSGPNDVTVDHLFEGIGPRVAGSTLELLVAGRGGVPADADAVLLNLTAVGPTGPGFLTVFPCGEALPKASHVNYAAGEVAPNAVLAKIGVGGKVCIYTKAQTDMIADVNGFVPAGGSPSSVVPARLLETRTGPNDVTVDHLFEGIGPRAAGSTLELVVAGRGGVPADAEAVMLNLTAVGPTGPGFLTVFPCGEPLPKASHVNYAAGEVAPNAVLAKIGAGGKVCIYTKAQTDMIADVNGYVG